MTFRPVARQPAGLVVVVDIIPPKNATFYDVPLCSTAGQDCVEARAGVANRNAMICVF